MDKTICKFRDGQECDNEVGLYLLTEKDYKYVDYGICATCMEGRKTRNLLKKRE